MDQNEAAESESQDQDTEPTESAPQAPARAFEVVLRGIVNVVYASEDKNFGLIDRGQDQYYYDPRLVAAEEPPVRGDTVFFAAKPPIKKGAKPVAACVLVKGKPAVGMVVNMLPSGRAGFLQVGDERGHRYNVYMSLPEEITEVSLGERFRFIASANRQGPSALRLEKVE